MSLGAAGCGAHLKREVVGSGGAAVQLRGQPGGAATTIELGRGQFDVALWFGIPRAQIIDFELTCAGMPVRRGQIGETFDAYRTRRLRELNAMADRDRRAAAAVTGAVVGAVTPTVRAQGQVSTPGATASVDAQVSGQQAGAAAGGAVAQEAFPAIMELPPGDVGQGRLSTHVEVGLGGPATCSLLTTADDANVLVQYQITQIRDLDQEARERRVAVHATAIQVRGQLTAQLEVAGADPWALQKRREAEARAKFEAQAARERARAEADAVRAEASAEVDAQRARERARIDAERAEADAANAQIRAEHEAADAQIRGQRDAEEATIRAERDRVRLEAQAKLELEARMKVDVRLRVEGNVRYTRTLLLGYLAGECHADPRKREREREAAELRIHLQLQAKLELEARIRAEREAREAKLHAEREARTEHERDERAVRDAKVQYERDQRAAFELEQRRAREAAASHRIELALGVRGELRSYLVTLGARERPPMPALMVESSGTQPFDGAVWVSGTWSWTGGQWVWATGGWQDRTRFGDSGTAGGAVVTTASSTTTTMVSVPTTVSAGASASTGTATGSSTANGGVSVTLPVPIEVNVGGSVRIGPKKGSGPTVRDHRH